jgi:conjugal transfer pilus assembly protein TraU
MQKTIKHTLAAAGLMLAVLTALPSYAQTTGSGTSSGSSGSGGVSTPGGGNSGGNSSGGYNPACHGTMFKPFSDMDWNLAFPITIMGVPAGGGTNPPLMYEPPVCVCPGPFGIPSYGVGITYWEPLYVSEIQRTPGCLSTLGGMQFSNKYMQLHGEHEQGSDDSNSGTATRMQGHWYQYPVFSMLDIMKSMACKSGSGFALGYITEIDPTWQDDAWGAMFTPEASLFANPIAQAACAVDAVSSQLGFTFDPLFWCAGAWGPMFPLTGNSQPGNGAFLVNGQIQAKFMFRLHRLGMLWQTIGPTATCFAHPNPVILKSQYRINQIGPIPRRGVSPPPVIGTHGAMLMPPVANTPALESTDNMIWQGQQCCARLY